MFHDLYSTVKTRYGEASSSQSMGDWITANTTIRRKSFSFKQYPFQKEIADDMHPDLSVIKASQIGLTEVQIRKFFAILTRNTGVNGIFSLPSETMRNRIYAGRMKPILDADSIFNPPTETKPTRSRDMIQIRDSFGYVTGASEGDATSISADFLMHDELDLSDLDMISLYQSRLQNSDMRVTQKFSTPTFTNYGIDKSYKLTDMREYVVQCAACNHYQIPMFTPRFIRSPFDIENFTDLPAAQISSADLSDVHIMCEHCHRPLDMTHKREWVAKHPSRQNFRGYWVRPFSTSRLTPQYVFTQLAKYSQEGYIRGFFNTVLGQPHLDAACQIQQSDIEKCLIPPSQTPTPPPGIPVYVGIDVGLICYLTLSYDDPTTGMPIFFLFEAVPQRTLATRIQDLRSTYNIVQGAVDRFPFEPDADALRVTTNDLIMPVQYRGNHPLVPVRNELGETTHYSAYSTYTLDRVQAYIQQHQIRFAGYGGKKDTIISHLTDPMRDERPGEAAVWRKNSGEDHYLHSIVFNFLARRIQDHTAQFITTPIARTLVLGTAALANTASLGLRPSRG